ncbi:STAS domain-containing protein [Rhodobacteraceae bacterium 2376]|uniref:Anti-sigma factor antagonist n=1 Tax=Rhabdonatronobacter sediminivivens TaxID=2743469 RepID=A0A7Z0HWJ4_9RHOB|nr:STAS domain-containing protein [Rhabdonatronobacter sediminivivens]NYS23649.1 STAS domain-containing protein [Rhabdonatronobacter sediminivivens]
MNISTQDLNGALVITLEEQRLDAAVALSFKEAVREALAEPGAPVILDMSRVDFLDSSGLGAVVAVMKLLGGDRRLELSGLTPNVAKVFRLTRMDTVFTLHDRLPERGASQATG